MNRGYGVGLIPVVWILGPLRKHPNHNTMAKQEGTTLEGPGRREQGAAMWIFRCNSFLGLLWCLIRVFGIEANTELHWKAHVATLTQETRGRLFPRAISSRRSIRQGVEIGLLPKFRLRVPNSEDGQMGRMFSVSLRQRRFRLVLPRGSSSQE